ncbi:hypothetical protein [Profundibacterium mesophilum]|uniref:Uncharacterized protein n=1 Tax=Profundibacterium mesophilum KAUST100406-0324 TaxID=1037889 RepID=A0A921TBI7_9RHOB|nr:hypothetical protein [Profundibacterium mesophilum]KAF0675735.1 hypothetical protein PMES_01821 [Profundibacterium mesophilum KAUST100406-0324]
MEFSQHTGFQDRCRAIARQKGVRRGRGIVLSLDRTGLRIAHGARPEMGASLKGMFLVCAVMFLGKSLMLAELGEMAYAERVARLSGGSLPERLGGWLFEVDPLSRELAAILLPLVR